MEEATGFGISLDVVGGKNGLENYRCCVLGNGDGGVVKTQKGAIKSGRTAVTSRHRQA